MGTSRNAVRSHQSEGKSEERVFIVTPHLGVRATALVDRLRHFPQGAPSSEVLFKIIAMLFSDREAALVAQIPIKMPTTNFARACKFSPVIIYGQYSGL